MSTTPALIMADLDRRLSALERTRSALAASADYLPLTGGTLTGSLTGTSGAFSSLTVGGTAVSVSGHTHSYAATTHTHDYAATTHTHAYASDTHTHSYLSTAGGTLSGGLTITTGSLLLNGAGNGVRFEGTVANAYEVTLVGPTLTADRTVTLPDATGTLSLDGHTHSYAATSHTHSYAATSHTHSYVSTSGGTVSGDLTVTGVVTTNEVRATDTGPASDCSFTWSGDEGSGMYLYAAGQPAISAAGSTGLICAGGTINTAGGATTTTSGYQYVLRNNTYGTLYRYSSRRSLKEQVTDLADAGAIIDALRPVTFVAAFVPREPDEVETDDQRQLRLADLNYGFIAEEVAQVADGKLAQWEWVDDDLEPAGWKWSDVIAVLVAEAQQLRRRVTELENTTQESSTP